MDEDFEDIPDLIGSAYKDNIGDSRFPPKVVDFVISFERTSHANPIQPVRPTVPVQKQLHFTEISYGDANSFQQKQIKKATLVKKHSILPKPVTPSVVHTSARLSPVVQPLFKQKVVTGQIPCRSCKNQ